MYACYWSAQQQLEIVSPQWYSIAAVTISHCSVWALHALYWKPVVYLIWSFGDCEHKEVKRNNKTGCCICLNVFLEYSMSRTFCKTLYRFNKACGSLLLEGWMTSQAEKNRLYPSIHFLNCLIRNQTVRATNYATTLSYLWTSFEHRWQSQGPGDKSGPLWPLIWPSKGPCT